MRTTRGGKTADAPTNVPFGTGSVGEPGGTPSGHYWDRLEAAKGDKDALDELIEHLEQHGYARDGQLFTATLAAYNEVAGAKRHRRREG